MPQSVTVDNADLFTPEIRDLLADLGRPLDEKVTAALETVSTPAGERVLPVAVAVLLSLAAGPPLRVRGEFHRGVELPYACEFETNPMPEPGAWFAIGRYAEEQPWILDLDQPDWTDPVVYQFAADERHKMLRDLPLSQRLAALTLDAPISEADRFPRACLLGDLPAVEAALAAGADPHQTPHGIAPLHLAASVAATSVVSALLAAGADPRTAASADIEIPLAYLDLDRHLVDYPRIYAGQSVLQTALRSQVALRDAEPSVPELVSVLLAAGADPDHADEGDGTAIHAPFASRLPAPQVLESVRLLLEAGADPNAGNDGRGTALHLVFIGAWDGHRPQGLRLLLDAGADPNVRNWSGERPLHYAFRSGRCRDEARSESLRLLLAAGADPNNVIDNYNRTALHYAFNGPFDTVDELLAGVRILLEAGADPNAADDMGDTVLHQAAGHSDIKGEDFGEAVRILVDAGADPNFANARGETALHCAFARYEPTVDELLAAIRILLTAGSDPNAPDDMGDTALHQAIRNRHLTDEGRREAVRILLDTGADPNAAGVHHGPALAMTEDPVCVRMLLDAGAKPL